MSALMHKDGVTGSSGLVVLRDIVSEDQKRLAGAGMSAPGKHHGNTTCIMRVVSMPVAELPE